MAELAAIGTALASAASAATAEIGIGTALSAAGTLASGVAADQAGRAQDKASRDKADYDAKMLEQAGAAEMAKATRVAEDRRAKTDHLIGRNIALSAASGGGTGGSNAQTLEDIYKEGEYLAQSDVVAGQMRQAGLKDKAAAGQYDAKVSGEMSKAKGRAALVGSVLSAGGKVYSGRAKLGVGYSEDDEDLYDSQSGWRTTMRRG